MIPDSVRRLDEIELLDGDERLIHAVSLLDFLVAVSPEFGRGETESLGAVINRHEERFSSIADLNFALGVRNKIIHPRPANAGDPDVMPPAVGRAANYVLETIDRDVARYAPEQVRTALLTSPEDNGAAASPADVYVAGWRYEPVPSNGFASLSNWSSPLPNVNAKRADKRSSWLNAAAESLRSMSSGTFWAVMACIPPALLVVVLLGNKLNSLLPGNLIVHGAVLLLIVAVVRWLRAG